MTPLEQAQLELDDLDRAAGVDQCPYWRPLYTPPPPPARPMYGGFTTTIALAEARRKAQLGATRTTIDGILKDTYDELVSDFNGANGWLYLPVPEPRVIDTAKAALSH